MNEEFKSLRSVLLHVFFVKGGYGPGYTSSLFASFLLCLIFLCWAGVFLPMSGEDGLGME